MAYKVPNQITEEGVTSRTKTFPYFYRTMFTFDKWRILKCAGPGSYTNVHFMTICHLEDTNNSCSHSDLCDFSGLTSVSCRIAIAFGLLKSKYSAVRSTFPFRLQVLCTFALLSKCSFYTANNSFVIRK